MTWATLIKLTMAVVALTVIPGCTSDTAAHITPISSCNSSRSIQAVDESLQALLQENTDIIKRNLEEQDDFTQTLMAKLKENTNETLLSSINTYDVETKALISSVDTDLRKLIADKAKAIKDKMTSIIEEKTTRFKVAMEKEIKKSDDHMKAIDLTCPSGWVHFHNKCVQVFSKMFRTWNGANEICEEKGKGGKLVHIENNLENYKIWALVQNIQLKRECIWIGLKKYSGSKKWQLSGRRSASYYRWLKGQPNQKTDENCACIGYVDGVDWVDEHCGTNYGFVCQINKVPKTEL